MEKNHILIVEESETQALRMQILLEAEGWVATHAANAEQALTVLKKARPDVLIIDYYLPEMSGDELRSRIRGNPAWRDIPVLMLTNDDAEARELRRTEGGALSYASKTESTDSLLMKLRVLIRTSLNKFFTLKRARILAIDDSPTYLAYLNTVLEDEDYDISTAPDGATGLEMIRRRRFDCVLVDLNMADMDGTEVCRKIVEMRSSIENPMVVLMLTSSESQEDMTEGLGSGADDFVGKGSDVEVLRARIRALLRRKFMQDENQRGIEEANHRELQKKNEELAGALATARAATEMKSRFLANMSHELRTPLNGIIGFAELLHDGKVGTVSEDQVDFLNDILASSHHLLGLINDILDISKIEAGKMQFYPEHVDLAALVAEVTSVLGPAAIKKEITVVTSISEDCTDAFIDPGKLKQVLYNYLSNALKFTPNKGSIRIDIQPAPDYCFRLEVVDTGMGIEPEHLERLFIEFEQLDSGIRHEQRGTGLGLALTKRIVEDQGGQVAVRSRRGEGCVFSAVLPRSPRNGPKAAQILKQLVVCEEGMAQV